MPPTVNISQHFLDEFLGHTSAEAALYLLNVDHPLLAQPIRLVLNTQEITSRGNVYNPAFFELELPDQQPDRAPRARIVLDNVDRGLISVLRQAGTQSPTVQIEVVCAGTPDVVESATPPLTWRRVEYDQLKISGDVTGPAIFNRGFPKDLYAPSTTPGIFKGPPL